MPQKFEADSPTFVLIRSHKFFRSKCSRAALGISKTILPAAQPFFKPDPGKDQQIRNTNDVKPCWQPPQLVQPRRRTQQAPCRPKTSTDKRNCCHRILTPHPGANRHLVYSHHARRQDKQQARDSPSQMHSHHAGNAQAQVSCCEISLPLTTMDTKAHEAKAVYFPFVVLCVLCGSL